MTRALRVAPEAEAELSAAVAWYEAKRSGLGVEFVAEIDAALERLQETPLACPLWHARRPFRRLVLRRFPFIIFFTVAEDHVSILAFAHAKRRPGYWLQRPAP